MTTKRRSNTDKLIAEIEVVLEPGRFISYGQIYEFVEDLEAIAAPTSSIRASTVTTT